MKNISFKLFSLCAAAFFAAPALAADVMVTGLQRCTTNEECKLVTSSCTDSCAYVPVSAANFPGIQQQYQNRCGKAMEANPKCNMNPPLSAACINSRCTIDYAYANNAGAGDYQSGAYSVPEAPAPSKVQGDYSNVDDRKTGFNAYDLPQGEVKQKTVGTLHETVYVPPSAPVSGGNYVPVTPGAQPQQMVQPPVAPPAAPVPTPAPAPALGTTPYNPAVAPMAPVAAPMPANVPPMRPPVPNQPAPPPAPAAAPQPYQYVPAPTAPTLPAPGLPVAPTPRAPDAQVPAVPAVGASGVPQAPPGSVPIPPSDLKPSPTFVPPAGTAIPVSPEDPGAPPPAGTTMIMQEGPDGSPGMTVNPGPEASSKKTFGGSPSKRSAYTDTNQ